MIVPCLMITHNRLEYTKKAVKSLMEVRGILPFIFDNGSTDGTVEWLKFQDFYPKLPRMFFSKENLGISGAMSFFLQETVNYEVCGKIDSDTIVEPDWCEKMLPFLKHADLIQSKHHIIPATNPEGWEGFTRNMKKKNGLYYHNFIGGSGILFKRDLVNSIPETESKIMGWREFQKQNPNLVKAFVPSVEIKLLDEHGYTDYPEYYKQTGRC